MLPVHRYTNYRSKVAQRYQAHQKVYTELPDTHHLYSVLLTLLDDYETKGRGKMAEFIHGDPVFTNIMYTASNNVVFLDMRGKLGDVISTSGDVMYDLAKVNPMHSLRRLVSAVLSCV